MQAPRIELIPSRPAVAADAPVTLDVLVRITPPAPDVHFPRPPVNLALVLDRSGSMSEGRKMGFARQAAVFAVEQLLPTDRVAVTIYDEVVETIAPSAPAADKPAIVRQIEQVRPRGSTDLHGGWAEGGRQAQKGLIPGGLNRVLLLSDGLANAGVTDPNTIAAEVRGLSARGVGTTTMGVGEHYNEDLMEAMARAGDGNYYYIETPVQLADIFQTELLGLMAAVGQKVSLGVEPEPGVAVSDVLNDLERLATGRLKLPHLVVGMPVQILVRLTVPPQPGRRPLCGFRLAWDAPGAPDRQALRATLDDLPAVPLAEWQALPLDPSVREQEALLMMARAQKEAGAALDRGDVAATRGHLAGAAGYAAYAPSSAEIAAEMAALRAMETDLDAGALALARKSSKFRAYWRRLKGSRPPEPPKP